ncbi:LOW QUALITY PROTEIN: interferon-inducible protein AIM2 [Bos taurus]|uniref:LOW QUALITY PROTEIN: interferon-inducible protein AIM2 n=1 Tax=Bos taurus TaxID=9913 RepID=UPI0028CBBF93|nr:LOW QUALITY PROTEIN: interferon-inducible protein AIM2 [Bos taurus]
MAEVPLTNVFLRPKKGKQEMCHAAVSTESEFFFVKVFNNKLKDKFTPSKIIMISKYYWHSCYLEVMLISLVCDTEFDQISVSKHIIRKDGDTSDYQKFGVGFIFSESRTEDHILCDLNDSTGMIEVLMLGNEEKIQCKERNKLQLTFLELSKTGEKLYLKSRVHSFINGEGNGTPLQYSCLENPMDGGAWLAAVHRVAKSWTRLSDFTFTFHFHALQKEMATHSSVLAWRIPGTVEPGGLRSVGSHRVGHD